MTESAQTRLGRLRIAGFPGRYLQGPGALEAVAEVARDLGAERLLLVSDDLVEQTVGPRLQAHLRAAKLPFQRLRFDGECTQAAIDVLAAEAREAGGGVLVALGGGKTIDTTKGIAKISGARLIIAPTIASNDSATSRLIVLYDEAHRGVGVDLLKRNPDAVIVDTTEIARAPIRFFRAGIGDAISKSFEAAQCAAAGGLNFHHGRPPRMARLLGDHCYCVLRDHGEAALADVARGNVSDAVEDVIEATVLLSGLAFESGGLSVAHALQRGLGALPALGGALHGELVAFGVLVQMLLERRDGAWRDQHLDLVRRLGLPATLASLGKAVLTPEELAEAATRALAAPYITNFDHPIDQAELMQAILDADALGRSLYG